MLTLSTIKNRLSELETRFGKEPIDTHIFAPGNVINALNAMFHHQDREDRDESFTLNSLMGMEIWHDPAVAVNEIEIGRVEYKNGVPHKVITKVVEIKP